MQADFEIADQFSFLEKERGFRCVHRSYDQKFFGNAIVEYVSATLRVRVVKDRGQFECDFARPKGVPEWFDADVVLRALGEDGTIDTLTAQSWSSLHDLARTIRDRLDRISELFAERNYRQTRARFQEVLRQRVAKNFGAIEP